MSQRDDTIEKFGPHLLEALALTALDEINILRQQLSLAPRTPDQLLQAISNHTAGLEPYSWQDPD